MKLLAITSCPNGIAHTYMAAENLQKAADKLGVQMKIETQGGIGVENELTEQDIREADGIIIAADRAVNKDRFIGKKLLVVGVQDGIRKPEELIQKVASGDVPVYHSQSKTVASNQQERKQNPIYRHLMNGVSFMVPFIVVGGLLIAIALTLGGEKTPGGLVIPEGSFWKEIEQIGGASFTFMVPILAGYIAYSIADKPGLVPGMIGGYIAATGSFYGSESGAGFLGGIIAGFLAGYIVLGIKKIKVPKAIQPIMPIIIIPVFATLVVGLAFIFIIGAPVAQAFELLTAWLAGMQGSSSILLALILGAMISFDMGGPVNKVAFLFGSAMIGEGNYEIMGPIAAAICIPPIGMGLATFIGKRKFQESEREMGKASFTMGLFGITEGAIPFAAQDPLRVIPSIMAGSMTGAVIAMIGHVGDRVAHGGPIVAVLGAVDNVFMFFVAVIVGSIVTALVVNVLKKDISKADMSEVVEIKEVSATKEIPQVLQETEVESKQVEIKKLTDITSLELIETDLTGETRDDIIDEMIQKLNHIGVLHSKAEFKQAIMNRENESTTGIGMNIAIPHGKSAAVKKPSVVFGIKQSGIDWKSLDGTKAKLIFMIAVPKESEGNEHLKILQILSRKLMDDSYRERLLSVRTKEEAYKLLDEIV
ncbi:MULTISPECIES: PTS fructose transporter subunit IIABC [Bacillus cereus group]|uniref:PTS system, fructose subfamily, IIC subunit n=1 Tax=Bacillus cytotoxicus (strain DSM 22905 / CIP 110041 / 391-98 / NVH 391-98) TaxID=315749 RepID=A7GMY6_BACCN|nr:MULTISPECIES: PTS fructose transporter subunit IIABC [Bacillus cereus group]ABS21494.1 PTS system, fructose subfamily, IIC subunit [Bacillus cytotoxicus NVH 391-98]AWC28137.1 PTS mannose transporter subunit IIABC [Bacillus cytotoxicus]AWC40480.1 PTS mannose transporter subunit IIABC [Bacillus cytotoxicus]AWC44199.1 PTS mannose transporter subunit IIABC [Bacillus cytotoxicus]AWC48411.1 PTS mannose transporter subunit IIABC [Bacillus cytotoxicus]